MQGHWTRLASSHEDNVGERLTPSETQMQCWATVLDPRFLCRGDVFFLSVYLPLSFMRMAHRGARRRWPCKSLFL